MRAATVLVGGWGCCALALPEGRRPALVLAFLGALAVLLALVTGWRLLGTVAVLFACATPMTAGALDQSAASPVRLTLTVLLALILIVGLDGVEGRRPPSGRGRVALRPVSPYHRAVAPLVALAAALALVSVAGVPGTPSVGLVLLGLLSGVGAMLVATREH